MDLVLVASEDSLVGLVAAAAAVVGAVVAVARVLLHRTEVADLLQGRNDQAAGDIQEAGPFHLKTADRLDIQEEVFVLAVEDHLDSREVVCFLAEAVEYRRESMAAVAMDHCSRRRFQRWTWLVPKSLRYTTIEGKCVSFYVLDIFYTTNK